MGGQTALNLAKDANEVGIWEKYNIKLIGVDIDAIAEALQRLSQLVTEFPQIKEMDINPFIVGREGVTPIAVDAMMTLEKR